VADKPLLIFPFTVPIDGAGKMRDPAQGIYARSMARALAERLGAAGTVQASCATLTSHGPPGDQEDVDPKEHGWVVASQPWSLDEACAVPLPEGTEHLLHGGAELTDRVRLRLLLIDQPREQLALDHVVLRPRAELFQALDEAAGAVAEALGTELPDQAWPTRDVEAFVAYMRGRDMSAAHEAGVHVLEPQRSFDGYLEAVRRDPEFSEAQERLLSLALDFALAGQGPLEAARSACERLLAQDPRAHMAHAALAEIELARGTPQAARAELLKLLAIRPDWSPAFERLGTALMRLGENEQALHWFDAAVRERPDDADTLFGRGAALSALGRNEEAIASWDALLKLSNPSIPLHEHLAHAFAALGRRAEARLHRNLARKLSGKPRFPLLSAIGALFRRLT
jgi:tetratricopeptide (TPR) repeat protein